MAYVINLDLYELIETHWIAFYVNDDNGSASYDATYFDSFGVEHIPKQIKKLIGNTNIITNIYRTQGYNWIMCEYFCMGFIDFMLKAKSLLDYTNLFSLKEYKKNDKLISKHFNN